MSKVTLNPPEPFNFARPDDWSRWKRRFEQFRVASGLDSESGAKQVSMLLYCMGGEAEMVLTSVGVKKKENEEYEEVMRKLDKHFQVRRNVIFERARFNRRDQLDGETAEKYITELYSLVEHCDYGTMTEEMLRDRLVVGIRDKMMSEKLQLDQDLTLEKAKIIIRQREAIHDQAEVLQVGEKMALDGAFTQKKPHQIASNHPERNRKKCIRCGKGQHPYHACPAKDTVCHKCHSKGHFQNQCLSKTVAEIQPEDVDEEVKMESAFLSGVEAEGIRPWMVQVQVCGVPQKFKIDTGAEVTAISEASFKSCRAGWKLKLSRPASSVLEVVGEFKGRLSYGNKTTLQSVYVVKNLKVNLLGLPAVIALALVAKVDALSTKPGVAGQFPSLFQGLGSLGEPYQIKLQPDAKPFALFTARHVPLPLRDKVKQELEKMVDLGVISKVDVPTPWCAGMVVASKKNGDIRICIDFKLLNNYVQREVHPLPKVDDVLAQLAGAKVFSKLDANSGFWQIPLAEQSRLLTTFITPYGRYCFNKLPFGICSAPEHFQKRMSQILEGLDGVLCQMDDVLLFGKNKEEHDVRLRAALEKLEAAGVTLNEEKCEFEKSRLLFLGHIIDEQGIHADPNKTASIKNMKPPQNVSELRQFLGMANQLGKFSCGLSELTKPLRELLGKNTAWQWEKAQLEAFEETKKELCKPTVLAFYDPTLPTKVSADASSFGLGAVLLQEKDSVWKPVSYASRSMSETERRYAQIEKEALAVTWACEKFADYIIGLKVQLETDHKPLVPLLGTKQMSDLPPRILRFRMRLARFDYVINHVPGKLLCTADALSRAPLTHTPTTPEEEEEVEYLMEACVSHLPASHHQLSEYIKAQAQDAVCSQIMRYCTEGWPDKHKILPVLKPYWKLQGELTDHNNLLLFRTRIVVPNALQRETLQKIHNGHQGIQRCRLRAQSSVWWPGISQHISDLIENCHVCAKKSKQYHEPLMSTPLPDYPWQRVASDLFFLGSDSYLLIVDYFSRYPEVIKLKSTTSRGIIEAMKAVFSRYGIPQTVRSDNGPQYSSEEFSKFAAEYNFYHETSSPHFAQSNGQAERTVQTMKNLLRESTDPYMALLTYRSTPLPWCGLSPAELLMGRCLRTNLPQVVDRLKYTWQYIERFRKKDKEFKDEQKRHYDQRHKCRPLPDIPDGSKVWVMDGDIPTPATETHQVEAPRSYTVETEKGTIRRNRYHLKAVPPVPDPEGGTLPSSTEAEKMVAGDQRNQIYQQTETTSPPHRIMTRSRTGTAIRPPDRY